MVSVAILIAEGEEAVGDIAYHHCRHITGRVGKLRVPSGQSRERPVDGGLAGCDEEAAEAISHDLPEQGLPFRRQT